MDNFSSLEVERDVIPQLRDELEETFGDDYKIKGGKAEYSNPAQEHIRFYRTDRETGARERLEFLIADLEEYGVEEAVARGLFTSEDAPLNPD
jgi:hypothetical protein